MIKVLGMVFIVVILICIIGTILIGVVDNYIDENENKIEEHFKNKKIKDKN